jgi:CheY-like chemotaxis protein
MRRQPSRVLTWIQDAIPNGEYDLTRHTVTLVNDGRQALKILRVERFDLVLLGIIMPVLDSYQVPAEMEPCPLLRDIHPIVVLADQALFGSERWVLCD